MRKLTWISAPLLLAALLLGACTTEEEPDETLDGNPLADATVGDTPGPSVPTAALTPTSTATTEGGNGGGDGGDASQLAAIAEQFATAQFTATYMIQGDSAGESIDGEWTWYQDPEGNRLRFDFAAEGQDMIMIIADEQTLLCSEGACLDMGAGMGQVPNIGELLTGEIESVQEEAMTANVTAAGSREIAGSETDCYEFEDSANDSTGTVCYTSEGVPLLMETSSPEGDFSMEATAYEDSVSDDDFEPPFPVTTLGG